MSERNIMRAHLKSREAMGFFGQAFGSMVLKPGLDDERRGPAGLVVAAYGPTGVGKTEILINACRVFPEFFKTLQRNPKFAHLSGVLNFDGSRAFLFKDNGAEIASDLPHGGPLVDMRHGLGIFEHPRLSDLDAASFVMLIGSPFGVTRNAQDYFARQPNRRENPFTTFYEPEAISQGSSNTSAVSIAKEMIQMRLVATNEPGHEKFLRTFSCLKGDIGLPPKDTRQRKSVPFSSSTLNREDRYVSLFLINPSPAMRQNFESLRSTLLISPTP